MEPFKDLAARAAEELGPTRAAAAAGVTEQTLRSWINGDRSPLPVSEPEYRRLLKKALRDNDRTGSITV